MNDDTDTITAVNDFNGLWEAIDACLEAFNARMQELADTLARITADFDASQDVNQQCQPPPRFPNAYRQPAHVRRAAVPQRRARAQQRWHPPL